AAPGRRAVRPAAAQRRPRHTRRRAATVLLPGAGHPRAARRVRLGGGPRPGPGRDRPIPVRGHHRDGTVPPRRTRRGSPAFRLTGPAPAASRAAAATRSGPGSATIPRPGTAALVAVTFTVTLVQCNHSTSY